MHFKHSDLLPFSFPDSSRSGKQDREIIERFSLIRGEGQGAEGSFCEIGVGVLS